MAEIIRDANHPNLLLVVGSDVFGSDPEYRDRLRDTLYSNVTPSISRGSHDFWITYRVPEIPDQEANHSREDIGLQPRPMRGIIYMQPPADDSDDTLVNQVGTLMHEVGHHWLVPDDLRFHMASGEVGMMGTRELVDRQNDDVGWELPPLIGRTRNHWSSYFQADGSPMDGMHWVDRGIEHWVTRWDQQDPPVSNITEDTTPDVIIAGASSPARPPGRTIRLGSMYCDLDLILMNALRSEDAYPSTDNQIRWNGPFITSNMNYHAGISVAFSKTDQIYFGFYRDHRRLAVQRTGQPLSLEVDIGNSHNLFEPTALRVVRRGSQLIFQAAAAGTDLINGSSNEAPFNGGIFPLSEVFQTVATLGVREEPIAVGALLKTWSPLLVEADYDQLTLFDSLGERSFPVDLDPPEFPRDDLYESVLSPNELRRYDVPGPALLHRASFVRTHEGRLQLGTRYAVNPFIGDPVLFEDADHWVGADRAPKALVRVQPGDFTFGTQMRVRRCIFSPWAAGAVRGCSMWGHPGSLFARDVIVPARIQEKWRGDNDLRFAFIVVARQRSDITESQLVSIDLIRRLWDTAFGLATRRRWISQSHLLPAIVATG